MSELHDLLTVEAERRRPAARPDFAVIVERRLARTLRRRAVAVTTGAVAVAVAAVAVLAISGPAGDTTARLAVEESSSAAPQPSAVPPSPDVESLAEQGLQCNGPCTVEHQLTEAFVPGSSDEQTLLLASSPGPDDDGNRLHAFLVDREGEVLWQAHGFGQLWQPVDESSAIRYDSAGHLFFRAYAADLTYLYVLDVSARPPRLVSPQWPQGDGFQLGEVVDSGKAAFDVTETLIECPDDPDVSFLECPRRTVLHRWDGQRFTDGTDASTADAGDGDEAPAAGTYEYLDCTQLRAGDPVGETYDLSCDPAGQVEQSTMDCMNGTYVRLVRPGQDDLEGIVGESPTWVTGGPLDARWGRTRFAFEHCHEHE